MSTRPDILLRAEKIAPALRVRARLFSAVREFFDARGFLEVQTPLIVDAPAPEEYIEAVSVGRHFLRTSPELQMKVLLAAGEGRIYQIGPCFRDGEFGSRHRPEFTMLEWYQAGAGYLDILDFTTDMIVFAAQKLAGRRSITWQGAEIDLSPPWDRISVREAFEKFAGCHPDEAIDKNVFEELLVEKVEPSLPRGRPVFMIDYPERFCAFSKIRKSPGGNVSERWELYMGGMELANAYSELTDSDEQKARFDKFAKTRASLGLKKFPAPSDFLAAITHGMPESGGCALGLDRLTMLFADSADIAGTVYPNDYLDGRDAVI